MELKLMSECNTEDTSQLKDTRRWNLNRLTTNVAIYVHFKDCTSAQIKKTEMEPQVASTSKFFYIRCLIDGTQAFAFAVCYRQEAYQYTCKR
jgi:hypothetical protein